MSLLGRAAVLGLGLAFFGLAGCEETPEVHWDPIGIPGRDGGAPALTFDAVMHIADVSRQAGDYSNAVNLYRHAGTMQPKNPAPLVGLGGTLLEMGKVDEAINNYQAALKLSERDGEALRGLARAYLKSGRPELSAGPLAIAYQDSPRDPKVLLLLGVADDYLGHHDAAQSRYREGLQYAPADRSVLLDLALSLALSEKYDDAMGVLRPLALGPKATPQERQTLALIYGLKGDETNARSLARIDLDPVSVDHNIAYYDSLRRLSADARGRAIMSASASPRAPQS
jgi:Flp pilus assembly protein TadD